MTSNNTCCSHHSTCLGSPGTQPFLEYYSYEKASEQQNTVENPPTSQIMQNTDKKHTVFTQKTICFLQHYPNHNHLIKDRHRSDNIGKRPYTTRLDIPLTTRFKCCGVKDITGNSSTEKRAFRPNPILTTLLYTMFRRFLGVSAQDKFLKRSTDEVATKFLFNRNVQQHWESKYFTGKEKIIYTTSLQELCKTVALDLRDQRYSNDNSIGESDISKNSKGLGCLWDTYS